MHSPHPKLPKKTSKKRPSFLTRITKTKRFDLYFEVVVIAFIVLILCLKVSNYAHIDLTNPSHLAEVVGSKYDETALSISELKYFGTCPKGELKIDTGQDYLCRQPTKASIYQKIYDTYPRNPDGRNLIYPYLAQTNNSLAKGLLDNEYTVPGFMAVTLKYPLNWQENNFNNPAWRNDFYSLSVFKDLLYQTNGKGNAAYQQRLESVLTSFLSTGTKQAYSWDDNTEVALRAMILSQAWSELRAENALPIGLSNEMLASIEQHGNYLLASSHYDSDTYLDTDEAASLYSLGVAFPTLPNAEAWARVGSQRLNDNIHELVSPDGALLENSPSQDLSVLQKVWDINEYSAKFKRPIGSGLKALTDTMITYATHIVQPNSELPLMGRSAEQKVTDSGTYRDIAANNANFQYVLSQGGSGSTPKKSTVQFKSIGQTIFLSNDKSKAYSQQTQLVFNYGTTSTQYAHLDDLSFDLYGDGAALLPGSIVPSNASQAVQQYFLSTGSHNTVTVDGQNQTAGGSGSPGSFYTSNNYSYQAAADQLNPGVTHERQIVTIGSDIVLVFDKLNATSRHTYQQTFNLAPNAKVTRNGLAVTESLDGGSKQLTISQLDSSGVTLSDNYNQQGQNISGICSVQVNQVVPCHQLVYKQVASDASYVTLLQVGKPDPSLQYHLQNGTLSLTANGKHYTFKINETQGKGYAATVSNSTVPQPKLTAVDSLTNPNNWDVSNGNLSASNDGPKSGTTSLELTSSTDGRGAVMKKTVDLNLSNKNLVFSMKIPSTVNINDIDLLLYTNGTSYAKDALQSAYNAVTDNDEATSETYSLSTTKNGWSQISLGKGSQRDAEGQWTVVGNSFSWSDITAVAFRLGSSNGTTSEAFFSGLYTMPAQPYGKVLLTFDDGTSSILPAATAMKADGFVGNVGVIGKYANDDTNGYLTVPQLRTLQSDDWSLINHSYYHQDAITAYFDTGHMNDFRQDILMGSEFLEQNGLDTDPNWYIYPHGTTNSQIESVVGQYYKFARTELTGPEVYPFGNDLAVKDFVVENSTTPQSVESAIADARDYNQTLILTFHRIYSKPGDQSGYNLGQFEEILDYLKQSKVAVMSFNQLDKSNGVPIEKLHVSVGYPSQLDVSVKQTSASLWYHIRSVF